MRSHSRNNPQGHPVRLCVSGVAGAAEEPTYHKTGFIRDNLEHVCDRNVAQALGYCQRCGSILGKAAERARSHKEWTLGGKHCPFHTDQAPVDTPHLGAQSKAPAHVQAQTGVSNDARQDGVPGRGGRGDSKSVALSAGVSK